MRFILARVKAQSQGQLKAGFDTSFQALTVQEHQRAAILFPNQAIFCDFALLVHCLQPRFIARPGRNASGLCQPLEAGHRRDLEV